MSLVLRTATLGLARRYGAMFVATCQPIGPRLCSHGPWPKDRSVPCRTRFRFLRRKLRFFLLTRGKGRGGRGGWNEMGGCANHLREIRPHTTVPIIAIVPF